MTSRARLLTAVARDPDFIVHALLARVLVAMVALESVPKVTEHSLTGGGGRRRGTNHPAFDGRHLASGTERVLGPEDVNRFHIALVVRRRNGH